MISLRRWFPLVILLLAVVVLFYELVLGRVLFWGVVSIQFYPWRDAAFEQLRSGMLPFWNPALGNGAPLLANLQTAVFYPPNWLYLVIPTEYANGFVAMWHVLWAGLGMWAYLGRLQLDRLGRGVGALAFALGGYLIARFGFLSVTSAVPWLPWLFWAADGVITEGRVKYWRYTGYLGLFIGLQLLAGHAQTSFYSLLFIGTYTLWLAYQQRPKPTRFLLALLGVALGLGLALIQLLPTYELLNVSPRSTGADLEEALAYSFWPWRGLTIIAPGLFGTPAQGNYWGYATHWEDALYMGFIPIILIVVALIRKKQPDALAFKHVPYFALGCIPITILALGRFTPVFPWLFENVPTFDLFRGPTRWMLFVAFAFSTLAAIGAHGWRTTNRTVSWAGRIITIGLAVLIAAGAVQVLLAGIVDPAFIRAAFRLGIVAIISGALPLLLRKQQRNEEKRFYWEGLVLTVLALDLVTAHWGNNPTISADFYDPQVDLAQEILVAASTGRVLYLPEDETEIKFEEIFLFEDYRADDTAHWQLLRQSLLPNIGYLADIDSAVNDDPLTVGHHTDLINEAERLQSIEILQQMNATVLLSARERDDMVPLGQAGPARAYGIPDPWSRVELADCQPSGDQHLCTRIDGGSAMIASEQQNQIVVEVTVPQDAWLVLVDTYYPGWGAEISSEPVRVERVNGAFRGVPVSQGQSTVTFSYWNRLFPVGAGVTAISFLIILSLMILPERLTNPND